MDSIIYAIYSLSYIGLFLWGTVLMRRHGLFLFKNFLLLVTIGLIYDNTVLALGTLVGEGSLLKGLNLARYWMHALFTPTLILFAWAAARQAGVDWLNTKTARISALTFTGAMIIWELLQNTIGITIEPALKYGALSYEPAKSGGPPVMIIGVTISLLAGGIILLKKLNWKWMALGVILMGIGSAVPIPVKSDAATNGFELILLVSLWGTKAYLDKQKSWLRI